MREPFLVLWALTLGACGAGQRTPGHPTVEDDPLSVSENQQGSPEPIAAGLPVTSSPLPNTYVWCANEAGMSCLRVTAALGAIAIKNPANAPAALFLLEDLPDDCVAPGMAEIRRRLDVTLTLNAAGWRDQGGAQLDAAAYPDIYAASGCIADSAAPVIKIAASSATPRLYLVRVWETSGGY